MWRICIHEQYVPPTLQRKTFSSLGHVEINVCMEQWEVTSQLQISTALTPRHYKAKKFRNASKKKKIPLTKVERNNRRTGQLSLSV